MTCQEPCVSSGRRRKRLANVPVNAAATHPSGRQVGLAARQVSRSPRQIPRELIPDQHPSGSSTLLSPEASAGQQSSGLAAKPLSGRRAEADRAFRLAERLGSVRERRNALAGWAVLFEG